MKNIPSISDAEWQVMKVLWAESPMSSNQIVEKLGGLNDWKPKTIKTLISRLLAKKAIAYHADQRTYLYYPLIDEQDCKNAESNSFIERVYNGSVNGMIANFIENRKLSKKDIEDLKKILEDKDV